MGMVIRILIIELVALGSIKMLGIGFNSYLRKLCLFEIVFQLRKSMVCQLRKSMVFISFSYSYK